MAPLVVSFHLLLEDQGLVFSAVFVPLDSNWFMLCPWAMSFFQKLCPAPFLPVTMVWPEKKKNSIDENTPPKCKVCLRKGFPKTNI